MGSFGARQQKVGLGSSVPAQPLPGLSAFGKCFGRLKWRQTRALLKSASDRDAAQERLTPLLTGVQTCMNFVYCEPAAERWERPSP